MTSNQYITHITQNIDQEFHHFIEYLKNLDKKSASYSKVKDAFYKDEWNKKKIILQELSQLNFTNPISKIHEFYLKAEYDTLLLSEEIKSIENILFNVSKDKLYNSQEKLGFIKRIIDVFLDYYIKQKFNPIIYSLNKLNSMEFSIKASLEIIKSTKDKQSIFKQKVLINHGEYLMKLQKVNNMKKVIGLSSEILSFYRKFKLSIGFNNKINNKCFEILSELMAESRQLSAKFKPSEYNSKHNLLILDGIDTTIKSKLREVTDKIDDYSSLILQVNEENTEGRVDNIFLYLDYILLYISYSNRKVDLYVNVSLKYIFVLLYPINQCYERIYL